MTVSFFFQTTPCTLHALGATIQRHQPSNHHRDGVLKFMFRIADVRNAQVVEPKVLAYLYTWGDGRTTAEGEYIPFRADPLNIGYVDGMLLLPLTIEHTIDERSPLYGHTYDSLMVRLWDTGQSLPCCVLVLFAGVVFAGVSCCSMLCLAAPCAAALSCNQLPILPRTHNKPQATTNLVHTQQTLYTPTHRQSRAKSSSPLKAPRSMATRLWPGSPTFPRKSTGGTSLPRSSSAAPTTLATRSTWGGALHVPVLMRVPCLDGVCAACVHVSMAYVAYVCMCRFHDVEPQRGLPMLPPNRLSQLVVGRQVLYG